MNIKLRDANENDLMLMFDWANNPAVRKNAFAREKIILDSHKTWFLNKLNSATAEMYILELNNEPVGQIRFDYENGTWVIDYSIGENHRGKGLGSQLIILGIKKLKKKVIAPIIIKALVDNDNSSSNTIFKKLGFKLIDQLQIDERRFNTYLLDDTIENNV